MISSVSSTEPTSRTCETQFLCFGIVTSQRHVLTHCTSSHLLLLCVPALQCRRSQFDMIIQSALSQLLTQNRSSNSCIGSTHRNQVTGCLCRSKEASTAL